MKFITLLTRVAANQRARWGGTGGLSGSRGLQSEDLHAIDWGRARDVLVEWCRDDSSTLQSLPLNEVAVGRSVDPFLLVRWLGYYESFLSA